MLPLYLGIPGRYSELKVGQWCLFARQACLVTWKTPGERMCHLPRPLNAKADKAQ